MRAVVLDTGPVVGLLHEQDEHHDSTIEGLQRSVDRGRALVTAWEVVGEAFTLFRMRLRGRHAGQEMTVLDWAQKSGVAVVQSADLDQRRAIELLRAHADLRLSYIDALLLAISERLGAEELLTVDGHLAAVRLSTNLVVSRV